MSTITSPVEQAGRFLESLFLDYNDVEEASAKIELQKLARDFQSITTRTQLILIKSDDSIILCFDKSVCVLHAY